MKIVSSILIWVFMGFITLLVFLAVLFLEVFLFPFDRKRKLAHAQGFWWSDALIKFNPFWSLSVSGLENIDRNKTYVMVANHQSLVDIVMVYKVRMQFKWVAKAILFKIPIFGWTMYGMKYIKLARGKHGSIRKVYQEAGEWLKKDISVLFFPEGTRSAKEEMGHFLNGAFKLAIKEKKPILPIVIQGSSNVITKGSWIFKTKAACRLIVLPEIDTAGYEPQDFARLRDKVREQLALTD